MMEKQEILHNISNKMVLPMSVLEMVAQIGSKSRMAQEQMREIFQEIKKGLSDETSNE